MKSFGFKEVKLNVADVKSADYFSMALSFPAVLVGCCWGTVER